MAQDFSGRRTLNVGAYPYGLAVSPNGKELWVANYGSTCGQIPGTISVFDTATGNLQTTLEPGGNPWMFAFAKQVAPADVLNYASTGFIQFINTTSWVVARSVGAAGQLISPDGMTVNGARSISQMLPTVSAFAMRATAFRWPSS
jgi:DNA-binding beta-propeller fold protein YncE